MKFIASTSSLLKHLQIISGVISTNNVLPILEDFLFVIKEGKLTVFSTDLETSMSTSIDVEAKEDGHIAIPAKILIETLKTLPEQPITFSMDLSTNAVELTSSNGKYKLVGENGDDYPKIPVAEDVNDIQIPATILNGAINNTIFATSNDELKPAMAGVYVQIDDSGSTFVATDAHKLVRFKHTQTKSSQASSFILPKKALNLLKTALPEDDTAISVSYNNANAFFTFGDINLICRLIDARYPDYKAVIPTDNPNHLNISRKEFLNTIKRISIYSNKTTHQVLLKISGSELQISAKDLDFSNEANERLTCQYEGSDIEIGFNAKFLVEMLSVLDSNEIRLELSAPTRAGVIFPAEQTENQEILMLIMPVMLNA